MAQGNVFKSSAAAKMAKALRKKKGAANKHGRGGMKTKRGMFVCAPKKVALVRKAAEDKEVTKLIIARNESAAAGAAQGAGGRLQILSAPKEDAEEKLKKGQKRGAAASAAAGVEEDGGGGKMVLGV